MVGVGQDIGLPAQITGWTAETRQDVGEENLKPFLRQRQAGGETHHVRLYLRIQGAQSSPGGLGNPAGRPVFLHAPSS